MPQHFAHQAIDGSWHCVYRAPCGALTSVSDEATKAQAQAAADRLNNQTVPADPVSNQGV